MNEPIDQPSERPPFRGFTTPDSSPVRIDPTGFPSDASPTIAILGLPGTGRSVLAGPSSR